MGHWLLAVPLKWEIGLLPLWMKMQVTLPALLVLRLHGSISIGIQALLFLQFAD